MPTYEITDFRHGLDLRKSALTAVGGSLQILDNAFLSQGGDIVKRLAFYGIAVWPSDRNGCFGLFGQGGMLHTFGTTPPTAGLNDPGRLGFGMKIPVLYHQLVPDGFWNGMSMTGVIDIEVYKGKFWVAATLADGLVQNFYDGVHMHNAPSSTMARVYQSKMYRTQGSLLRFSAIDDPTTDENTQISPGGGFIDVSANDPDAETLLGLEVYYNELALFARLATQIWSVDPDPSMNVLKQVIRTGAVAGQSVMQYGTGDVLFLSDSGVRSLRALNMTLAASVIDVGSPIDSLLTEAIRADGGVNASLARAVVQPVSGRYWLAVGYTIYCLSFFPSAKISAWSTFSVGFVVAHFAVVGNAVYVMDTNNNIYLYGGPDGQTYDNSIVTVRTPHDPVGKTSIMKKVSAVSAVLTGAWSIGLGMAADNTDLFEPVANVVNTTTTQHRIPASGHGSHMALQLVCTSAGPATISSLALDYATNEKL